MDPTARGEARPARVPASGSRGASAARAGTSAPRAGDVSARRRATPTRQPSSPGRAGQTASTPADPTARAAPPATPPPAPSRSATGAASDPRPEEDPGGGAPAQVRPGGPFTLAIDIGGTGLKASVLDASDTMVADRVRVDTTYPMPPERLVDTLVDLVGNLPDFDRASAGFPGMVRGGVVLSAPHFVTVAGPGSKVDKRLVAAWDHFDLATALATRLGKPTRVDNDAEVQGAAVVTGHGLELAITLGTGVGTAVFLDGKLQAHLELAQHPLSHDQTYNERIGDAARKKIGKKRWNRRVRRAVATLDALLFPDHVYIGGGNSSRITIDLGDKVTLVDNSAGILGGLRLWEREGG